MSCLSFYRHSKSKCSINAYKANALFLDQASVLSPIFPTWWTKQYPLPLCLKQKVPQADALACLSWTCSALQHQACLTRNLQLTLPQTPKLPISLWSKCQKAKDPQMSKVCPPSQISKPFKNFSFKIFSLSLLRPARKHKEDRCHLPHSLEAIFGCF